jgi:hypothetical protein
LNPFSLFFGNYILDIPFDKPPPSLHNKLLSCPPGTSCFSLIEGTKEEGLLFYFRGKEGRRPRGYTVHRFSLAKKEPPQRMVLYTTATQAIGHFEDILFDYFGASKTSSGFYQPFHRKGTAIP